MEFETDNINQIPVNQNYLSLLTDELRKLVCITEFPLVPKTDDEFLAKFIRTRNYKIDSAFNSVRKYYGNVYINLDIIQGMRPTDYISAFLSKTVTLLPQRHEGARVGICSIRNWNPKENYLRKIQLSSLFLVEEGILEVETQDNGIIIIFDMGGIRWDHIQHLTPNELKRIVLTGTEGLPMKITSIHFVNPPLLFWSIYSILIRLFNEKIRKRVHMHYKLKTLQRFVPKEILPEALGGLIPDDKANDTKFYETMIQKNMPYERYWNGEIVESMPK